MCRSKVKCNPCRIADLLPKRRNAQNRFPLYGFGTILGVFFRYNNGTLFNYLLYFFFLLTTVVAMAAPPLVNSRTIHKARLLVSPVCCHLSDVPGLVLAGLFSRAAIASSIAFAILSTSDCSVIFLPRTTALTAASTPEKSL